jgi:hypothetical protein
LLDQRRNQTGSFGYVPVVDVLRGKSLKLDNFMAGGGTTDSADSEVVRAFRSEVLYRVPEEFEHEWRLKK